MAAGFKLRVITPEALFYEGTADSVILETVDGFMGFLAGRAPACVLLAAEGKLRFREKKEEDDSGKGKDTAEENNMHKQGKVPSEEGFLEAYLEGGFAYMKEDLVIYTDKADWPLTEEEEADGEGGKLSDKKIEKLTPTTEPKA